MEILNGYLDYRKNKPLYKEWKQKRSEQEAKRLAYIEKHGIKEAQKENDIKRAKVVLNAVDIMDEYSQTRAEDAEIYTEATKGTIIGLATQIATFGGLALAVFCSKQKNLNKISEKLILFPTVANCAVLALLGPFLNQWGARKEIQASRTGRIESMQKDLSSTKQFAILNKEQEKERDEIASKIKVDKKEKKKITQNASLGILKNIKQLFKKDQTLNEAQNKFKKETEKERKNFNKPLTQEEIEEAKKDKQLITNIVEKIDIASQDYAENLELATTIFSTLTLAGGVLVGFVTNKLLSLLKINQNKKLIASFATGGIISIILSSIAAKIQKQGSRVARFKVKQEFLNNPEKLIYVDDEKAKNEDGSKYINQDKKPNFLKFLLKAYKDNKEYNQYLKQHNENSIKQRKAQEKIQITPEQEKRAKQLQQNIFKIYNRLDEKSQAYSESTEAVGETVITIGSIISSIAMVLLAKKSAAKDFINKNISVLSVLKSVAPILTGVIPIFILQAIITKEQKNASRVANMLTINEMDDYRNFADYSDKKQLNESKSEIPLNKLTPPWAKQTHQG